MEVVVSGVGGGYELRVVKEIEEKEWFVAVVGCCIETCTSVCRIESICIYSAKRWARISNTVHHETIDLACKFTKVYDE